MTAIARGWNEKVITIPMMVKSNDNLLLIGITP
jgi:hypothetical protein